MNKKLALVILTAALAAVVIMVAVDLVQHPITPVTPSSALQPGSH